MLLLEKPESNPQIEGAFAELDKSVLNELADPRKDICSVLVLRTYFNALSETLRGILTCVNSLDHIDRLLVLAHAAVKSRLEDEFVDWALAAGNPGYTRFQEHLQEAEVLAQWCWSKQKTSSEASQNVDGYPNSVA
jgi:hypothetical protein